MAEITFQINDIHCEKCVEKIRKALENLGGFKGKKFSIGVNKIIKLNNVGIDKK